MIDIIYQCIRMVAEAMLLVTAGVCTGAVIASVVKIIHICKN